MLAGQELSTIEVMLYGLGLPGPEPVSCAVAAGQRQGWKYLSEGLSIVLQHGSSPGEQACPLQGHSHVCQLELQQQTNTAFGPGPLPAHGDS